MRTFTITFQSDQDTDTFLTAVQTVKFQKEVELIEINEDSSEEDMDMLDDSLDEFYDEPFDQDRYESLQKNMKDKYGINFFLLRP